MAYEPLHHKYRPQTFGDLVGQETIATTLSNALKQARIAPAYLFTGPRGTGKTSSARILAKSLNCLASDRPTPHPCGKCEVCLAIAKGSALDVMEIDAASNTGVDNIREIIERSRFAPVQCRYKIYAIDECLTGDSLIQTDNGLMRINDPNLKGKRVLSYSENRETWEYKKVIRWLERGTKRTITIKTGGSEISCTTNHLIRTETGWIEAGNVKEGMKILSPVNVDAGKRSTSMERMGEYAGLTVLNNSNGWNTSLDQVESVSHGGHEKVYDLEVEDNHNFVANGLLVHNCHMLSTAAFNALLKTLEEPPPQVVFILATTDPQRVLSTIISRCQRFDYRRIPLAEMTSHLRYIADAEKIAIADDALTLVAQISNGGLRDAESLLDQLSLLAPVPTTGNPQDRTGALLPETITVEKVWDLVGAVPEQDLLKLLQAINSNDSIAVLQQCRSLLDRGREPLVVLQNLASFYLNLLIAKTAPQHSELTAVTETCWQQLCESGKNWQTSLILRGQQHLKEAETQLKRTTQPRLWLEVTLLGLLPEVHNSIATNPQTVVPTSPQQIVTPLPTVVITQSTTLQSTTPQSTPPQNTQAVPDIPVETNHLPPASPTQQPYSAPPAVQSPPPQVQQNPNPQQTAVTPEQIAPSTDQDPAANQQIWNKVVSCLQPPTTKQLLEQKCHLVNFDGMSAIVGVSSANLEKMIQPRISNIESAFAQVCQRKVRVQLEVASAKKNPNNNSHQAIASIPQPPVEAPPPPSPPPPPVNTHTQIAQPSEKDVAIQTNNAPRQAQTAPLKSSIHESTEQPQGVNRQSASIASPLSIRGDRSLGDNVAIPDPKSDRELALDQDYEDSDLQQAIKSLTHSFEGEVVQLDNDLNNLDDDFEEEEVEVLPELEVIASSEGPDVEDYEWLDDF